MNKAQKNLKSKSESSHNERSAQTELGHEKRFTGKIINCFDSHVHWRATGYVSRLVSLHHLRDESEVHALRIQPENYFGDWIVGYGWDHNQFQNKKYPSRKTLDEKFGDTPVYFKRIDGHVAWVNTAAIKRVQCWQKNLSSPNGGQIILDESGYPSGIFVDLAMTPFMPYITSNDLQSVKSDLLLAQKRFHAAGFTHIRDLTCEPLQWQAEFELMKSSELQLAVEQYFSADDPKQFHDRLKLALQARQQINDFEKAELEKTRDPSQLKPHALLRPKGVKIYYDGALGSEGALLSRDYLSGSGRGLQLLDDQDLIEMMHECAKHGLTIAVHTIGDEAAHRVVSAATLLKQKDVHVDLHLEHAELLRAETIALMRDIHVTCHMQPCHWLSDKRWLKEKIGPLMSRVFCWRELEDNAIKFDFGSDSPIEPTSVQINIDAMNDAATFGVQATKHHPTHYHSHSDHEWTLHTESHFENGHVSQILLLGQPLTPTA